MLIAFQNTKTWINTRQTQKHTHTHTMYMFFKCHLLQRRLHEIYPPEMYTLLRCRIFVCTSKHVFYLVSHTFYLKHGFLKLLIHFFRETYKLGQSSKQCISDETKSNPFVLQSNKQAIQKYDECKQFLQRDLQTILLNGRQ